MPFDRPSAAPLVFSGTSALKLRVLVGRSMLEVSSTISVAVVAVTLMVSEVEVGTSAQKDLTCCWAEEARGSLGQLL